MIKTFEEYNYMSGDSIIVSDIEHMLYELKDIGLESSVKISSNSYGDIKIKSIDIYINDTKHVFSEIERETIIEFLIRIKDYLNNIDNGWYSKSYYYSLPYFPDLFTVPISINFNLQTNIN